MRKKVVPTDWPEGSAVPSATSRSMAVREVMAPSPEGREMRVAGPSGRSARGAANNAEAEVDVWEKRRLPATSAAAMEHDSEGKVGISLVMAPDSQVTLKSM
jgi:hypothetical protein